MKVLDKLILRYFIATSLIILVQIIGGKYENNLIFILAWYFFSIIIPLFLFANYIKTKLPYHIYFITILIELVLAIPIGWNIYGIGYIAVLKVSILINTMLLLFIYLFSKNSNKKENSKKANQACFDVFITHSSKDKDVVKEIIKDLNNNMIKYWVDHEQILFGDQIIQKIEDGLKNSNFLLVILSNNLKESNWSRAEYGAILNIELSHNKKSPSKVIPLELEETDKLNIPFLLIDKKRVKYKNKKEYFELLQYLKKSATNKAIT